MCECESGFYKHFISYVYISSVSQHFRRGRDLSVTERLFPGDRNMVIKNALLRKEFFTGTTVYCVQWLSIEFIFRQNGRSLLFRLIRVEKLKEAANFVKKGLFAHRGEVQYITRTRLAVFIRNDAIYTTIEDIVRRPIKALIIKRIYLALKCFW